jgi:hypothetical protein
MSYKINTTDGRLLVDLVDGKIDTTTTDLNLIGRNVSGFGEFLNENFVKLAENFANSAPPAKPLAGQLWYDKSEQRLKVFNGRQFKPTDTTIVSANEPTLLAGDIWIDSVARQLYFSDGNGKVLAGPIYTTSQGETGFNIETLYDESGNSKIVAKLLIANSLVSIISKEEFTPSVTQPGFTGNIKAGFNISNLYSAFKFHGEADSAAQITQIGTLQTLNVDYITLNDSIISTETYPLQISSAGDIIINDNRKITGVGDPASAQDVATKNYVDNTVKSKLISLCLDVTGLTNIQIASVINDVNPATSNLNGTNARVSTFYQSGTSVIRGLKLYTVVGGSWTFNQDLTSSI